MEVVPEPNIVSARIRRFVMILKWPEHIKEPTLKKIKRKTSSNI